MFWDVATLAESAGISQRTHFGNSGYLTRLDQSIRQAGLLKEA